MPRPPRAMLREFGLARGGGLSQARAMAQGSAGNVIAAICSFIIPGLGQLVQGRVLKAALHFIITGLLWILGFFGAIPIFLIMQIWSCVEAARWRA
jgi:TM2 domain-containing membrane protein YozV